MINLGNLISNNVRRHPQSLECQLMRPVMSGGSKVIGGIGVLSDEDEDVLTYEFVGAGFMLPADDFIAAEVNDSGALEMGGLGPRTYLIAPDAPIGLPGWFAPEKDDILLCVVSDVLKLAWEVVGMDTATDYPIGLSLRYLCSRRADLDVLTTLLDQEISP